MARVSLHELSPFVRVCGEHQLPPGFRRLPYFIYEHEFIYVLSGQAGYRVGRTTHALVPGDLLLVPPAVFTESWNGGREPMRFQYVHFDFQFGGDYTDKPVRGRRRTAAELAKIRGALHTAPSLTLPPKVNLAGDQRVRLLFDRIIDEVARKLPAHELVTKACLLELLAYIERRQAQGPTVQNAGRSHPMVDRVVRFLHDRYASPLRLSQLAAEAHLNPVYLGRVFQQTHGCSPMAYLTRVRVTQAKRLLLATELAVKQVARSVGYDDPHYFGRVFQRLEGMPPLEYRKQARALVGIELVSNVAGAVPPTVSGLSYFTIPPRRL
jgi:AraC-like DNA-binding protein